MIQQETMRRLLRILHLGLVEIRRLAMGRNAEQISELADVLEVIPEYMDRWDDHYLQLIRASLEAYHTHYPGASFNYVQHLDGPLPERF